MNDAVLAIDDLHAWYGQSHVLHGAALAVGRGEIVSVLGRNGAGRSTLLKAVMRLVQAKGAVQFKGRELCGLQAHEVARLGIGYVPESRDIFPTLTVEQNLQLGMQRGKTPRWSIEQLMERFPSLAARRHTPAGVLSGGEQQMLTLCRTLTGAPDLVLVDEPTEGLAPAVVAQVRDFLVDLQQSGVSILLVEQKLAMALDISQRVYVMGHGRIVFEGTPAELRNHAAVRKEWLEI